MSRAAAPAEVAAMLAGLDIDAADVIASQAKASAKDLHRLGRGPCDSLAGVGYVGAADWLLGRCITADETRALEGCIRHYLRTGETS